MSTQRHRQIWRWVVLAGVLWPTVALAQLGSVPFVFTPNTPALSAEVNTNFSTAYANALNRTGGTMTGTLTTQAVLPDGDNTRNFGSAAASWAAAWFDGAVTFANTSVQILDTNASHALTLAPGSNITAARTLTLTTGDASRTLTISGDATVSQDYSTSGTPQFAQLGVGGAATAGGQLAALGTFAPVSGNAFSMLSATAVTIPANGVGGALLANGTITEAGSGTHALLTGVYIVAPTITGGVATVTNTASLYIDAAPSATVTGANYALWVDAGATALDGTLTVGGTATLSGTINMTGRTQFGGNGVDGDVTGLTLTCDGSTEDTPSIGEALFIRFTTAGSNTCLLKGITAPSTGTGARIIYIVNATGFAIGLNHEDASEGTAANRIVNNGSLGPANGEALGLIYDRTSSRWRVIR